MHYTINEITTITGGKLLNVRPTYKEKIEHVHFDSRLLEKNSLFIALTIGNQNGHDFIEKAIEKGATCILLSQEMYYYEYDNPKVSFILVEDTLQAFHKLAAYHREEMNIPVVAITGSNGKTSTKDILSHVLSTHKEILKTEKNFNNHLGVPLTLLQMKQGHEMAIIEVGMNHAGEIDELAHIIKPSFSIITNIGESHIEHLGSKENIAHAKGELLPHTNPRGFAILPNECEFLALLKEKYTGPIIQYGKEGDISYENILQKDEGTIFSFRLNDKTYEAFIPLYGEHNVLNVLPAIFIADQFAFPIEDILVSLSTIEISSMRFEKVENVKNNLVINDAYNASPSSMKESVTTFMNLFPQKEKVVVLGDMFELGKDAEVLHTEVGSFISKVSDSLHELITIGKDSFYISNAFHGNKKHFETVEEATTYIQQMKEKAVLFKASRGMKFEKIIEQLS